ncbi:hypothetical protein SAMN02745127_02900 [Oceanospirillum multiglobuliferum]|uniref:Uncharacterized protein n=1 Tax=Oceanospirillum multiglobuliferum TaxID=64969 RepID=A0A1T4SAR4_9GAMM|nr:hypothetical protein [Oceanospirillum multiglobuliferum]OPX55015.1 hypothetical protein BTE48_10985 [Oceanospirillum multiglobuliferum]SKA25410.1 hypothetical protein SAMN02745127_02900 [Oceanospirillum multiglobuliferum]
MGQDEVVYLLSDFSPERYVYLRFYVQYVYNMVRAVLGAGAAHYSPLLLVYNPDDHDDCNLLKSLQQHQQTMDIVL